MDRNKKENKTKQVKRVKFINVLRRSSTVQ